MKLNIRQIALAFIAGATMAACTTYETPASIAVDIQDKDSSDLNVTRKVLWVNIDGARGSVVKQLVEDGSLPNLKSVLEHSKYSLNGLSDGHDGIRGANSSSTGEDPVSWASMLTGVSSNLHYIHEGSYLPDYPVNPNPDDQPIAFFPSIIKYVASNSADMQTSVVTPWGNVNKYLTDASSSITTSTDEQTQEELKAQLADGDYGLTIAAYRGVLDAGKQGGFTASNANYKQALQAVDKYIGTLKTTIESRKDAYYEDWLMVITSNVGGTDKGQTGGTSDAERDIFGIFYYPHYTKKEMEGEVITSPRFGDDSGVYAYIPDTMANYALKDKTLAVEFNLKMNPKEDGTYKGDNWTKVLGKDKWGVYRQRNSMKWYLSSSPAGQFPDTGHDYDIAKDPQWHSFFFSLEASDGGERQYTVSYDGLKTLFGATSSGFGLDKDSSMLNVGLYSLPTSFYISGIRLWDTSLTDAEVDANKGVYGPISKSHSKYAHLIGEWVLDGAHMKNDTVVANSIKGMPDLYFSGVPTFRKTANTLPDKIASNNLLMENTLPLPQILYWLFGKTAVDSKLEGYNFLQAYSLEEQWRTE